MIRNLKQHDIVFTVFRIFGLDCVARGVVSRIDKDNAPPVTAFVEWDMPMGMKPTKISVDELYRTPRRAILAYARKVVKDLEQQTYSMGGKHAGKVCR